MTNPNQGDTEERGKVLPARRGYLTVDDPALHEATAAPWEIMTTQIDRGTLGHWKDYLVTPSLIIYREGFAAAARLRGLSPDGILGFCLPLRLGGRSTFWNTPPKDGGFPATLPGDADAVFDAGQIHVMVLINLAFMRRTLPANVCHEFERAARERFIPASSAAVIALTTWLCDELRGFGDYPAALEYPAAVRAFEKDLLYRLAQVICMSEPGTTRPTASLRRRGLDRAIDYLRASDPAELTVPHLCTVAGVSQRTLEYGFREIFDLTPIGFIRRMRLHALRRELLLACSDEVTVQDIAFGMGFYQLGRLAREYRQLFDELPSHTLHRSFGDNPIERQPLIW
jgi:AraC family ethanolamine operon transcriptional activator